MIVRLLIALIGAIVVGLGLRVAGIAWPWDGLVAVGFGVLVAYFVIPRSSDGSLYRPMGGRPAP